MTAKTNCVYLMIPCVHSYYHACEKDTLRAGFRCFGVNAQWTQSRRRPAVSVGIAALLVDGALLAVRGSRVDAVVRVVDDVEPGVSALAGGVTRHAACGMSYAACAAARLARTEPGTTHQGRTAKLRAAQVELREATPCMYGVSWLSP